MQFEQKLIPAKLIRRYKRFLADVILETGEEITVHCPNSGSMLGCAGEGWPVLLSDSNNPTRKYRYTWELVHNGQCWIGINTHRANRIVEDALRTDGIPELSGYDSIRSEVKYGENSRIDLLLSRETELCYVEIKNVTLVGSDGNYQFPDAKTERGRKHLGELSEMVRQGHRAVMFFLIQRSDGDAFTPAADIDPKYARALKTAADADVEILAYRTDISPQEMSITERITVLL